MVSQSGFRRPLISASALLGVLLIAGAVWLWRQPGQSSLERANALIENGRLLQARRVLEEHLQQHPGDDAAHFRMGRLLKRAAPEAAARHLQAVSRESSQFAEAQRHLAHIAIERGDVKTAESALRTLLELDSEDFAVQLALAELLFHHDRAADALPHARKAAELNPSRAKTFLLLAEILDELVRTAEMEKPLRRALEIDPQLYPARLNLVYALFATGRYAAARKQVGRCLQQKPDDARAHWLKAKILREQGKPHAALETVRSGLEHDPHNFEARLLEAELLIFLRRAEEAYRKLRPLYSEHRTERRYIGLLARAAALSGHTDEARRWNRELLELIPGEGSPDRAADVKDPP